MFLHHHWQHLIPALSLITANERDGPFKFYSKDACPPLWVNAGLKA